MELVEVLCDLDLSPDWGAHFLHEILFCSAKGTRDSLECFIASTAGDEEVFTYKPLQPAQLPKRKHSRSLPTSLKGVFGLWNTCFKYSTNILFGIRAKLVKEFGVQILYRISIHLLDFGITSAAFQRELEERIAKLNQPGFKRTGGAERLNSSVWCPSDTIGTRMPTKQSQSFFGFAARSRSSPVRRS